MFAPDERQGRCLPHFSRNLKGSVALGGGENDFAHEQLPRRPRSNDELEEKAGLA
eukprot:CAMPEP_0180240496 /NCGR_PEP_ID=MMETSP0987-20121128/32135_1 /TAXON_ID=697907 /ORGANISM="non described non described, Strain CCMP2293" /LENGTH=54 /DNA_ID=CAMNT_0022207375 /DNA_START=828 /DNA_END=990 /DNA_ORIENTATION=+